MAEQKHAVILFDGVCNLCNASVDFVVRHDRKDRYRLAPLQSEVAREMLGDLAFDAAQTDSIVLIEKRGTSMQSTAALRIARGLGLPWSLLYAFIVIPRFIRDRVYAWIARNRYRWFGRRDTCRVPTPAERARFLAVLAALLLVGCAPAEQASGDDARTAIRIVFVTHGQAADPFWSVVSNGARAAAADLGVRVEYQAPTSFDMVEMSSLIDAAVASRPAALVVSIPDTAALARAVRAAAAALPVISINSGAEAWRQLGVLAHIGQTEYEAGFAAGERLRASGAVRVLCVNHEVGNAAQDLRCTGLADAVREAGGTTRVLAVDLADPDDTQQRIVNALRSDAAVDALLTLGPAAADPALAALQATGRMGSVRFATFDLTTAVLEALRDGRMLFALDQQQYLQGYLPVAFLVTYLETGAVPGGGDVVRTGPGFVTPDNAAAVMDAAARGVR